MKAFAEGQILHFKHKHFVLSIVYLTSFVLLSFIAVASLITIRHPYDGLTWQRSPSEVVEVDSRSPAAAAGFQSGDILLAVAGQPAEALKDNQLPLTVGNSVRITVLRGSETLSISLSPEFLPTTELLAKLVPLLVALCFALFSLGIWIYQPYDWRVILFWSFNQLGAAGLTFGTISSLGYLWATRWFGIILCLLSPVLIHFHAHVTGADQKPQQQRLLKGLYALSLIFGVLWSYRALPSDSPEYAVLSLAIQLYFVTAVAVTIFLLARAYYLTPLQTWRRPVRLVTFGTLIAFAPLLGLALLPSVLFGRELVAYELTFPFLLFMPLSQTAAIYRSNLLQIERLLNRRIINLTLLIILSVTYLTAFIKLFSFWSVPKDLEPLLWGVTTLLLGILFAVLRDRLQILTDRLFYSGWYNYRSVVTEMSRGLGGVVDSEELADLLVNRLINILHLESAALLLCSNDMELKLIRAVGCESVPPALSLDTALLSALLPAGQPLSTIELRTTLAKTRLTSTENLWLGHPQIEIWVPIRRSSQLQALLLLGRRLDGELFDEEDRRMLNTLAWGAAVAVENVKLVSVLQRRTEEVNRLYSQLLQSREEEQKRLARELHDGVIQNLINLLYYFNASSPMVPGVEENNNPLLHARLQEVIDELRDVCTRLRPAALDDLSLALAIEGYIEDAMDQQKLDIALNVSGGEFPRLQRLPEAIEVCLFRVMQEAVTNVFRHAEATKVWIDLTLESEFVSLEIRDDGKGFGCPVNLGSFTREHHFGLAGLQERLYLVGGTLIIDSIPGEGTVLHAEVAYSPTPVQVAPNNRHDT